MKLYDETMGWDAMRRDLRYTHAMLKASGAHGELATILALLLVRWDGIERERQDAEDALVDANAGVSWLDGVLDAHVKRFGARLLAQCDNNRDHKLYRAYFEEAPSKVAELALEAEIDRVAAWQGVRRELPAGDYAAESLGDIDATCAEGRAALARREDVQKRGAQVSLRIDAWRDEANLARRKVETALDEHANSHGLPRGWSAQFFQSAPRSTRKEPSPRRAPAQPSKPSQPPPA